MEKDRDIIDIIFDARENDDSFAFNDNELRDCCNVRKDCSRKLYSFIEKRVHPNSQPLIKSLTEKYVESINDEFAYTEKLYYKKGFTDAIALICAKR